MIQYSQQDVKMSNFLHEFRKYAHNIKQWPRIELNQNASKQSKQAYEEWLVLIV